jgi:hypothetical protein
VEVQLHSFLTSTLFVGVMNYSFWKLYIQTMSLWHSGIGGWTGSAEGHDTAMEK